MHGIVPQEVGVRFDGAEIVDADDHDVLAPGLDQGTQGQTPMRPNPLIATRTAIFFLHSFDWE